MEISVTVPASLVVVAVVVAVLVAVVVVGTVIVLVAVVGTMEVAVPDTRRSRRRGDSYGPNCLRGRKGGGSSSRGHCDGKSCGRGSGHSRGYKLRRATRCSIPNDYARSSDRLLICDHLGSGDEQLSRRPIDRGAFRFYAGCVLVIVDCFSRKHIGTSCFRLLHRDGSRQSLIVRDRLGHRHLHLHGGRNFIGGVDRAD